MRLGTVRIVVLSDNESSGGAAIAASRLSQALTGLGVEVIRIVGQTDWRPHPWKTELLMTHREHLLMKAIGKVSARLGTRAVGLVTSRRLGAILTRLQPDVISVHNLHTAGWGPELVAVSARLAPTVWTLHDMWSFTGRCAYAYDCRKFVTGCDATCPTPHEYPSLEPALIAPAWRLRRRILANRENLVAVCPSRWLAEEAGAGLWTGHRIEVIPNGLPLDRYVPLSRALARSALGVESSAPVVLMAAQALTARRKGGAMAVEAIEKTRSRPLTLITLGRGELPVASEGVNLISLGHIDHERTLVLAYNAADLLIHPAPVDNLPNVVMEAIACGTPCVGFAVGGVQEIVRHGTTGWLAQEVSQAGLAAAIDRSLAAIDKVQHLRSSCRGIAEAEYDARLQAQRYLAVFQSLQQPHLGTCRQHHAGRGKGTVTTAISSTQYGPTRRLVPRRSAQRTPR
jgi:glycosyltransferase involved in cell wall biosynthesis